MREGPLLRIPSLLALFSHPQLTQPLPTFICSSALLYNLASTEVQGILLLEPWFFLKKSQTTLVLTTKSPQFNGGLQLLTMAPKKLLLWPRPYRLLLLLTAQAHHVP